MRKVTVTLFVVTLCLIVHINARRTSSGGTRISSGSRGSSGGHSWGSWGGGGSSSGARNNWNKAKDRVSQSKPPTQSQPPPQPKPKPNPDNTRLSYGQHEPTPNQKPSDDYKASAPPMEHSNRQTVSNNQYQPSAPPMQNLGHQQSGTQHGGVGSSPGSPPPGWNVGGQQAGQHGSTGQNGQIGWNTGATGGHTGTGSNSQGNKPIGFDNVNKQAGQSQSYPNSQHSTNTHVNQNQNYNGQASYPQQPGYGQPNQGYGGYGHPNQGYGGYGHPNQGYGGYGHPNQGYGGYGHPNQGYGSYGGQGYNGAYSGGYGGYHPGPQGGYTAFGSYNPPGTNIHYGPVTYINGHTPAPAYSYYHSSDNSLLSFFVGYSVGRMFSSTHSDYFHGHTYTVHHYHHGERQAVPEKTTVQANTIIGCPQNITLLCLSNSYPVCMSNGTIMCVTNPALTVQCADNAQLQCVSSTIDCGKENSPPTCQDKNVTLSAQNTTTLSVPCVSSVSIFGDLSMLQKVINSTIPVNATFNATDVPSGTNLTMVTDGTNGTMSTTIVGVEVTTTPVPATSTAAAMPTQVNVFCVTVIAVPQALNQTSFNNVTAEAAKQYATPLADPIVQDRMWSFFGEVLDHIFG